MVKPKGLKYMYMANCMSILRTFKCIELSKCASLNWYCLIFLLVLFHFNTNLNLNMIFYINVINILPMHHRVAAFIFILYNVPMQFIYSKS